MAINGGTLYVGGRFIGIGGQPRNHIAALDTSTGNATIWNPNASWMVEALAMGSGVVYAGGYFTSIGGLARQGLAALDLVTGTATAWNPVPGPPCCDLGNIFALAVSGSTVYAGGKFLTMGGLPRSHLAAVDAATGAVLPWAPDPGGAVFNPRVFGLAVSGNELYVGGYFAAIAGQPQGMIARFITDAPTNSLLRLFDATWVSNGMLLRWQFDGSVPQSAVVVERAAQSAGPWTRLALDTRARGDVTEAVDPGAEAGQAYWYRLVVSLDGGPPQTFGPIQATRPADALVSGIIRFGPNPVSSTIGVEYAVARPEPVRLSVFDLTGREVEVLASGNIAPGHYSTQWPSQHERQPAAGVYFLRWQSPGQSSSHRLVLVH